MTYEQIINHPIYKQLFRKKSDSIYGKTIK